MALLTTGLVGLRHNPRLLKLPSYLSLLFLLVGVAWLFVLPLDQYARHTYVSENALLPGQVSTYFGGSEHNVFRAYRHEIARLREASQEQVAQRLGEIFESQGLKVARQKYNYTTPGRDITGQNVYALLQGPRADATEAIVLMAAWRNLDNVLNHSGVALVLTLARYFKRWSLWSKDILFVVTSDSTAGPQAWTDAYHSAHSTSQVEDLAIKGGALQGAIALDYTAGTGGHRFDKINLLYDGINGQLPNLDLFNTVVHIASTYMGISCTIHGMPDHKDSYTDRLETVFRGMVMQGLGQASGPHSSFMPYHVDAVTLQTVGNGWHDEMSLGRLVESSFRSLNNLLEHLHQSFFFYILMHSQRFVSIGTYLPAAMLIAVNFSISAILLWLLSGRSASGKAPLLASAKDKDKATRNGMAVLEHKGDITLVSKEMVETSEREMLAPLILLVSVHILGIVPFHLFTNSSHSTLLPFMGAIALISYAGPVFAAYALRNATSNMHQASTLLSCFSLLVLGISLATLSTLNFSLGFIIGILACPLSFVSVFVLPAGLRADTDKRDSIIPDSKVGSIFYLVLLSLLSPLTVVGGVGYFTAQFAQSKMWFDGLLLLVTSASQAWYIAGTWTSLIVWVIWWPAWFVGMTVGVSGVVGFDPADRKRYAGIAKTKRKGDD